MGQFLARVVNFKRPREESSDDEPSHRPAKRARQEASDPRAVQLQALLRSRDELAQLSGQLFDDVKGAGSDSLRQRDLKRFVNSLMERVGCGCVDVGCCNPDMLFARFDTDSDETLDRSEVQLLVGAILRRLLASLTKSTSCVETLDIPRKRLHKHYKNLKKLGEGGQGIAYLAENRAGQLVCVKSYDKENDNAPVEDIKQEYELMKSFNSPRVARTFDMFQDAQYVYMVNEPYFGKDLCYLVSNAADSGVDINECWLRGVFLQVLEGLVYLHHKAVMHCDLKEANVMVVDKNWSTPHIVLIDFGLALHYTAGDCGACGTPGYIPPETLQTGYWVPKGDVFSAGVMFYQIATGEQAPFVPQRDSISSGAFWSEVQDLTCSQEISFEQTSLSQGLVSVLKKMLAKPFKARPTSAQCLQTDWFAKPAPAQVVSQDAIDALRRLHHSNCVQKAASERLLATCNLAQLHDLNGLFTRLDLNNDGCITAAEARQALGSLDGCSKELCDVVVSALQAGGDIDYKTFMAQMMSTQAKFETRHISEMFQEVDADGDGFITFEELPRLADMCGYSGSLKSFMKKLDADGDGKITLHEFKSVCLGAS